MLDRSAEEAGHRGSHRIRPGEDAAVRRALNEIVLGSIQPICGGLAILYGVLAIGQGRVLPSPVATVMMPVAAATSLLFLGVRLAVRRWEVPARLAHPLGAAIAGLVLLNSLLHVFLTGEPIQTTNLLLLVLGVGIVFLDGAWFAVVVAATFAGWFLAMQASPPSGEWFHFGFALLAATILASAILMIRIRTFRRIEVLHFGERMRQLELEASLERTESARRGEEEARRELEKAVTQLRESEERFRRLAEATFEGVVVSQGGRIVDANSRTAELFRKPVAKLIGSDVEDLLIPAATEDPDPGRKGGDGSREEQVVETEGLRSDGSRFPMEVTVTRATYEGRPATVSVIRDVTVRKQVEGVLRETAREAEASSRQKSAFLATMSHELRTPLNAVIGFSNILLKNKEGGISERELEYVRRIVSNGRHLLTLIDDVLDLSKIEAGRMEVEVEPVELEPLLRDVATSLEFQARQKGVDLRVEIPPGSDPLPADEKRLRQVLLNLLGNAVKFTSEGWVAVRVVNEPGTVRPARIEVEDTGIGIPAKRLPHIFTAFQQVDGSTARRYGGTGLGLTISRSLCELMGFELKARSRVGKGSVFTIDLHPPFEPERPGQKAEPLDLRAL